VTIIISFTVTLDPTDQFPPQVVETLPDQAVPTSRRHLWRQLLFDFMGDGDGTESTVS
jgi:hypothetical protein